MPRDGANQYYYPPGTEGIPSTVIESAKYNNYITDVKNDLNFPRPIVVGGTGATTAAQALINLGAVGKVGGSDNAMTGPLTINSTGTLFNIGSTVQGANYGTIYKYGTLAVPIGRLGADGGAAISGGVGDNVALVGLNGLFLQASAGDASLASSNNVLLTAGDVIALVGDTMSVLTAGLIWSARSAAQVSNYAAFQKYDGSTDIGLIGADGGAAISGGVGDNFAVVGSKSLYAHANAGNLTLSASVDISMAAGGSLGIAVDTLFLATTARIFDMRATAQVSNYGAFQKYDGSTNIGFIGADGGAAISGGVGDNFAVVGLNSLLLAALAGSLNLSASGAIQMTAGSAIQMTVVGAFGLNASTLNLVTTSTILTARSTTQGSNYVAIRKYDDSAPIGYLGADGGAAISGGGGDNFALSGVNALYLRANNGALDLAASGNVKAVAGGIFDLAGLSLTLVTSDLLWSVRSSVQVLNYGRFLKYDNSAVIGRIGADGGAAVGGGAGDQFGVVGVNGLYLIGGSAQVQLTGSTVLASVPVTISNANAALHVDTTGAGNNASIYLRQSGAQKWFIFNANGTSDRLYIYDAGNDHGVYLAQDTTTWAAASDGRFPWKANAKPLTVLDKLDGFKLYDFGSSYGPGVIAQELYETDLRGLVDKGDDDAEIKIPWGVRYGHMAQIALGGVQELHAIIKAQEARIAALEGHHV